MKVSIPTSCCYHDEAYLFPLCRLGVVVVGRRRIFDTGVGVLGGFGRFARHRDDATGVGSHSGAENSTLSRKGAVLSDFLVVLLFCFVVVAHTVTASTRGRRAGVRQSVSVEMSTQPCLVLKRKSTLNEEQTR